jgi:hypothetical protein
VGSPLLAAISGESRLDLGESGSTWCGLGEELVDRRLLSVGLSAGRDGQPSEHDGTGASERTGAAEFVH